MGNYYSFGRTYKIADSAKKDVRAVYNALREASPSIEVRLLECRETYGKMIIRISSDETPNLHLAEMILMIVGGWEHPRKYKVFPYTKKGIASCKAANMKDALEYGNEEEVVKAVILSM